MFEVGEVGGKEVGHVGGISPGHDAAKMRTGVVLAWRC